MTLGDFKQLVDKASILSNTYEYTQSTPGKRGLAFCVAGEVIIDEKIAKVLVGISDSFPNCPPIFFLLNEVDFIPLPHAESDGFICYTHSDTLVLDIDNPSGIIAGCFQLALKTLLDGIRRTDNNEFYNEYEAYWRRLKGAGVVFANIELGEEVEIIKYSKSNDKKSLFAVSNSTDRINSHSYLFNGKNSQPQFFNGLYIPLKQGTELLIPKGNQTLMLADVEDLIFKNVTRDNDRKIRAALTKSRQEDLIVIKFPQPNGNNSLFAIRFKGINHNSHPLITPASTVGVLPYNVKRFDPEYMLIRGGNGNSFINKKVLVIGGGSIGGAISEELIKAAIINVDIVDKDILEIDNCYRHICGFKYVHEKKAEAIKKKLTSYYPHAMVNAFSISIEEAITKKRINLNSYDAIIVATGNASVNQFLMRFFKKEIPGKPVLYSWLDPYGLGGHCLIANLPAKGCYQCLYENPDLHNSASFAAANQQKSFVKNISGCGSVYVPYGSLDANQTAILAVRKVLDVFLGKETINAVYSWKGSSELFLKRDIICPTDTTSP